MRPDRNMPYRRFFWITLFYLILSSFQGNTLPKTTRLLNDNLELLNGNVKQLIETEHNHTMESEYPEAWSIITDFDKKSDVVSQRRAELWDKKWHKIEYSYKYDAAGEKTEVRVRTSEKLLSIYKYGKDEVIQSLILYWNKNQSQGKVIFKYDKLGNVIEVNPTEGNYFFKSRYVYDNKGHVIKEIDMPDDKGQGFVYSIEYKSFDQKGNWLEKVKQSPVFYPFPNSKGMRKADTIIRKITYY
jgi:hypothetical protein